MLLIMLSVHSFYNLKTLLNIRIFLKENQGVYSLCTLGMSGNVGERCWNPSYKGENPAHVGRGDCWIFYDECKKSVEESLKKLKTDYLDLMLLHQPFGDAYGAWRALEEFYEEGVLKAIGISNFYADRMVEFASFNRIKPMVNQVECHPLNQQIEAKKWNDKYGIQLEAWAPFGEGRGGLFENPVLKEIAAVHGKSTAQVMLRWHLQRGIVVIPKSTHKERMAENLAVFDFTLTAEEMAKITALDTATSSFFSHQDPAMVEWFVKMVEERKKQQNSSKEKKAW